MSETLERSEQFGGDFGVTVIFTLDAEYVYHVDFFAAEIVGRGVPDNAALYTKKGADVSGDHVEDPHQAERFVEGSVKWDGCSHLWFGDENAYVHLCGRKAFDKLSILLPQIYERCGELMKERGVGLLEGEFHAE